MIRRHHVRRLAFTLIELLTVIALIAVLGALGVYFLPSFNNAAQSARGAGMLQNWLQIARTRAMRDGIPTGLRLTLSTNPNTSFQYIAQPDDYAVGQATLAAGATNVNFSATCDLRGSTNDNVVGDDIAGAGRGDCIEFLGSGLVRRIQSVTGPTSLMLVGNANPPFSSVAVVPDSTATFPNSTIVRPNYRIIRQPRVADDDTLVLPTNIIIDPAMSKQLPTGTISVPTTTGAPPFDIVFAPNGSVITPGISDKVVFYVRDGTIQTSVRDGEPTLIVVYARSGLTASFPVVPTAGQEYSLVK